MTLSPFIIYLWGIADSLIHTFEVISFICGFLAVIGTVVFTITICCDDEDAQFANKKMRPIYFPVVAITFVSLLVSTFLPSSKTIALMVVVPAILSSEPIQKDLPEIYQMAKDALKQTLAEKE